MLNQNKADYPLLFFLGGGGYLSRKMPTAEMVFVSPSSETVKASENF